MPLIFILDAVPERRAVMEHTLLEAGYTVETFSTTRIFDTAQQQTPSAILVALELPDGNGIEFREKVRQDPILSDAPVVLLADNKRDMYRAILESDLDECISFPFAPGELVTVVEAALRRANRTSGASCDLVIDPYAMRISVRGKEIRTTALEFRVIDYMARHRGKVFTRDALLDAVWGDLQFVTPRSVDACIRRIRGKMEREMTSPHFLKTVRGVGYKLDARAVWEEGGGACQCPTCCATRSRMKSVFPGVIGY